MTSRTENEYSVVYLYLYQNKNFVVCVTWCTMLSYAHTMPPNQAAHIESLIKSQNIFCLTFLWAICVGITQNPNLLYRVENVFMYYYNTVVNWGISVNIIMLNISQVHAMVLYLHNWQATKHSKYLTFGMNIKWF